MTIRGKLVAVLATAALAVSALGAGATVSMAAPKAPAPKPKAGVVCVKANQSVKAGAQTLKCTRNASGKLTWSVVKRLTVSRASAILAPQTSASLVRTSVSSPMPMEYPVAGSSIQAAVRGPSGYDIIADPNDGGSPEVVYPEPEEAEAPNPALAPAVTGVAIANLTETSVDIRFEPVAGVTGPYQVYLRYADSFTLKGADGANPLVRFTDLTPGWDYVACAYYLQPRESSRACVNVRTLGSAPVQPAPVAGPSGVVATAVDDTIEVAWDELAGAERYTVSIEYNTSFQMGGYSEIGGQRNHIRFNSGSVSPGLNYKVRVTALLANGQWTTESMTTVRSNGSQPSAPTKLAAPSNLRVTDVTPTTVTVAWDSSLPADAITAWQVVARYLTSYTAIGVDPTARTFTIPNLNPGFGYQIIVSGYNQYTGIWTEESRVSILLPSS